MEDQTSLYLRLASTEAESTVRETLLDTIGMTKELRAEARQVLFIHDLVDAYGHLTLGSPPGLLRGLYVKIHKVASRVTAKVDFG